MKKALYTLIFYGLPWWAHAQDLRPLNASDPLEKIILKEKEKLDNVAHFKTDVWISNTEDNQADPHRGIILNSGKIKQCLQRSDIHNPEVGVMLILAHEKAHFVQYSSYGAEKIMKYNNEAKRVIECQADILASKFLFESLTPNFNEQNVSQMANNIPQPIYEEALRLFFDLGEDNYSELSHPYKEQRLMAVKIGRWAGDIIRQQKAIDHYGRNMSDDTLVKLKRSIAYQCKIINFVPGEDTLNWSFMEAERIVHYSMVSGRDIVFERKNIDWHSILDAPYVDCSLKVTNKGEKSLSVDFELRTEMVPKSDPDNISESEMVDAQNYKIELEPGESYIVNTKLDWHANFRNIPDKENYERQLIIPVDPTGFVNVQDKNDTYIDGDKSTNNITALFFSEPHNNEEKINSLLDIIGQIKKSSADNFASIISGPGEKIRSIDADVPDFTCYRCLNPFSDILLYVPNSPAKTPSVNIFFGTPDDSEQNQKIYNAVIDKINSSYSSELSDGELSAVPLANFFGTPDDSEQNQKIYNAIIDKINSSYRSKLSDGESAVPLANFKGNVYTFNNSGFFFRVIKYNDRVLISFFI